jgi:DNA-binding NarL/FixJ family response regulator
MSNCLEQIEDIEIVGTATGGRRALEQSAKLHPNLVLLDLQMPDMNGLETAAELRRSCPDARIIMVTTLDIPEMHGASLAAGAHAFLSKSRLPEELAPQLRELFH